MESGIESSTSAMYIPPEPVAPQQVTSGGKDKEAESSKAVESEKPKATATTGNFVNIKA